MNKFEQIKRPLAIGLSAAAGMLAVAGCGNRSMEDLAETNGFSNPTSIKEVKGDYNRFTLDVLYGKCRVTLRTAEPWYEDYTATYLPEDKSLPEVEAATAAKLSKLPEQYNLEACDVPTIVKR